MRILLLVSCSSFFLAASVLVVCFDETTAFLTPSNYGIQSQVVLHSPRNPSASKTTLFLDLKSNTQWKRKRYLMMKDVRQAIRNHNPRALHKAEIMVRRMVALEQKTQHPEYAPTLPVLNLFLHAIAKSDEKFKGQLAEDVLRNRVEPRMTPNIVSYTTVLDAYAQQSRYDPEAPQHAERIFWEILQESERRNLPVTPVTVDTILCAWAHQGQAQKAQDILFRMEALGKPTPHSYATVIHAWATSHRGREAAEAAQGLLERLLKQNPSMVDAVLYNAAIHAWANSNDPQSGSKAMALLRRMLQDNADGCEPDIITYNTVLSALAHSGHKNSAKQAQKILQDVIANTGLQPTAITYNNVLHAWAKNGKADKAEQILKYMVSSAEIQPDSYSFSHVMDALAKSKTAEVPDKARRCYAWLQEMIRSRTRLSIVPFNTVLNAAAFSREADDVNKKDALQVAVNTFSIIRKHSVEPDSITYGNMLKCFSNLMPRNEARNRMALQVFDRCIEAGLVNELVWTEVKRAVPAKLLFSKYKLRGSIGSMTLRNLPASWTRQVLRKQDREKKVSRKRQKGTSETEKSEGPSKQPYRRFVTINERSYESGRDI